MTLAMCMCICLQVSLALICILCSYSIHKFSFGSENEELAVAEADRLKKKLGVVNPLDGVKAHTEECEYTFDGFLDSGLISFV